MKKIINKAQFSPMKPRIRVFSNRLEFLNPGALPKPYKELQKGDISLPRNPLITKIFRVIDLAENAGYGFDKMFKGWRYHYHQDPVVLTGLDYYRIEFFFEDKYEKKRIKEYQESGQILTERQKEILKIIGENPLISREGLSERLKINSSAIQKHIEKLKQKGLIKRVGPDKGGYWEVLK